MKPKKTGMVTGVLSWAVIFVLLFIGLITYNEHFLKVSVIFAIVVN